MTATAVLKILVVGQGGRFLRVVLVLWQTINALRIALLRLSTQVEKARVSR